MRSRSLISILIIFSIILLAAGCGGGGSGGSDDTSFTVSYNANGAESGSVPASQSSATQLFIRDNTGNLAKAGYLFDGWNTAADGTGRDYAPGAKYNGDDLTLYAKWAAIYNVQILGGGSPAPALGGVQRSPGSSNLKILGLTEKGRTLTSINIPEAIDGNTVKAIGSGAFQGCGFITELTISVTVTAIEGNAFAGCTGLNTLTVPESVASIGAGAFSGCTSLSRLIILATDPPDIGTGVLEGTAAAILVPGAASGNYIADPSWSAYSASIEGFYIVTFDSAGGSAVDRQIIVVGNTATKPAPDPIRKESLFVDWYKGVEIFNFSTPITENMTLTAHWKYMYTVTFDDQGATTPVDQRTKTVLEPATTVKFPSHPAKTDFVFYGWFTEPNGGGTQFTELTTVTGDITVYAKWVIKDPIYTSKNNLKAGDIVLANGKYVSYNNFLVSPSGYAAISSPVGVVAYKGITGTAGTTGNVYMISLRNGWKVWAKQYSSGRERFATSNTDGSSNWSVIQRKDRAGAENAATIYPAFNYCNTYSVTGYTSGWFLPSIGELLEMNKNITAIRNSLDILVALGRANNIPSDSSIWSSSQEEADNFDYWAQTLIPERGYPTRDEKKKSHHVFAFRTVD